MVIARQTTTTTTTRNKAGKGIGKDEENEFKI
jgi:hypothetical protein